MSARTVVVEADTSPKSFEDQADCEIDVVGAMGGKSKKIAESGDIRLDIVSGVIDKAILMVLSGKRCLILTSGGMVGHAVERIDGYAETSGIAINVGVVGARGRVIFDYAADVIWSAISIGAGRSVSFMHRGGTGCNRMMRCDLYGILIVR